MQKFFCPHSDITAFELAIIFGMISRPFSTKPLLRESIHFSQEQWDALDESFHRHFKDDSVYAKGEK